MPHLPALASDSNILPFVNPSVTSGGYLPNHNILSPPQFRFHYSTSHSNAIVIIPFVRAACSNSRRTTRHTASLPKITKPCPPSSPPRRTDCSTSSSCTRWRVFTPARDQQDPRMLQTMRASPFNRGRPRRRGRPRSRWRGGAGAATPYRRAEAPVVSVLSDDEEGADLLSPANHTSLTLELETLGGSRNGGA
jgi:hypothetical protein